MSNASITSVTTNAPILTTNAPILSARQNELKSRSEKVLTLQSELNELNSLTVTNEKAPQSDVFTKFDLSLVTDDDVSNLNVDDVNFLGFGSNKKNFFVYGELGNTNSMRLTPIMLGLKSNQYPFFLSEYRVQLAEQGTNFNAPLSEFELATNINTCILNGSVFNAQTTCVYVLGIGEFSRENLVCLHDAKRRIVFESSCLAIALSNTLSHYGQKSNEAKKFELQAQIEAAKKAYEKVLLIESSVIEAKNLAISLSIAKNAAIAALKTNKVSVTATLQATTLPAIDGNIAKGVKIDDANDEASNDEASNEAATNEAATNDEATNDEASNEAPNVPLTRSQKMAQNKKNA